MHRREQPGRAADRQHRLQGLGDHVDEITASLWAVDTRRGETEAAFRTELLQELAATTQRIAVLEQDMAKAERRDALRQLTAPITGTIQQLAIRTPGGVVTPAQELMRIVPADAELIVEADILNRDIGFIEVGQTAEIKVETYPFTRYGMLHGVIVSVSSDSQDQADPTQSGAAVPQASPEQTNFRARLAIEGGTLSLDGQPADLSSGMIVSAEIKTGTRTVIEFLVAPLIRFGSESLRER